MKNIIISLFMAIILILSVGIPVFASDGGVVDIILSDPEINGGNTQGETGVASGGVTFNYDVTSDNPATPIWWTFDLNGADYTRVIFEYTYTVTSPSGTVIASGGYSDILTDSEINISGGSQLSGTYSETWNEPLYYYEDGEYTVEQSGTISGEYGEGIWKPIWVYVPRHGWIPGHWVVSGYEADDGSYVANGDLTDEDSNFIKKYIKPEPINHYDMPSWYPMQSQFGIWAGGIYIYNLIGINTLPAIEKETVVTTGSFQKKIKITIPPDTKVAGGNILRAFLSTDGKLVVASTSSKPLAFSNLITISVKVGGEWVEVAKLNTVLPTGQVIVTP